MLEKKLPNFPRKYLMQVNWSILQVTIHYAVYIFFSKLKTLKFNKYDNFLLQSIEITGPAEAEALGGKVDSAILLLTDYNGRLLKEMEDRKLLTKMLHDFTVSQKDLLVQAEERLKVCTSFLRVSNEIQGSPPQLICAFSLIRNTKKNLIKSIRFALNVSV